MSEFLAPTTDAMRQTTTIKTKMEEEKKQRGFDSTSRSIISDISRSHSRPITPSKSSSKIPFLKEEYAKSPMKTRDRIPRTPVRHQHDHSGNDFQREVDDLEHSIVVPNKSYNPPQFGGKPSKPVQEPAKAKPTSQVTKQTKIGKL